MALLHLVSSPRGERRSYPLQALCVPIGRAESSSVRLLDKTVSGVHATVRRTGEAWVLEDNGSLNGTQVNRARVERHVLQHNDVIAIGPFQLRFDAYAEPSVELQPQAPAGRPVSLLVEPRFDVTVERNYGVLYEAIQKLSAINDLATLLDAVLQTVLDHVPADYLVALLYDPERADFVPKASRFKPGVRPIDPVPVSRTILQKCIDGLHAVFVPDVSLEQDLEKSIGVARAKAKSLLAIPLVKHEKAIGVVYAAGLARAGQFTHEDHSLLHAVVSIASVAVERAVLAERAQREAALRAHFERYFSPDVAEALARQGMGGRGPTMREGKVTVLFSDLQGFTRLSEKLSPTEVSVFLGQYFSLMTDVILRHGGAVDKFLGDGILAVFGMLQETPDDAVRAMDAALDMLETWGAVRSEEGARRLPLRIGLNTGRAFAGTIHTPHRDECTVLGDTVNVAARLESIADGDSVNVSAATRAEDRGGRYAFEDLGPQKLHSREQPVHVFRLRGRAPGSGR
jgi:adenylate cyclase